MPSLVAPSSRLAPDGSKPLGRILGPVSAPGPPGGSWRAKKITFFIKIGQINRNRGLQPTRLWVKLGSMSGTPTTTTTTKGTKMTTELRPIRPWYAASGNVQKWYEAGKYLLKIEATPKIGWAPATKPTPEPAVCADGEHQDDNHWDITYGADCFRCKKCWSIVYDG